MSRRPPYPFTALVGQHEMQMGLLIASIDPLVGGVLILGDRGTGKSTAVRALAAVLPEQQVISGCAYRCAGGMAAGLCARCATPDSAAKIQKKDFVRAPVPVVDLPLGASEDRILGALNLERLMASGSKEFEPGLLAQAHRGFLYVDEINLLEDHLVDLLIDVAASGENRVEREGLSVVHPAQFVLVGSGNPEEGDLRPQLLDRFCLAVEVRTTTVLGERIEVIRRREAYDRDPHGFVESFSEAQMSLQRRIVAAQKNLPKVVVKEIVLAHAAQLCMSLGTDGLRGELALLRAAKALAALNGLKTVTLREVKQVAPMVLRHRLRRDPLDEVDASERVRLALESLQ